MSIGDLQSTIIIESTHSVHRLLGIEFQLTLPPSLSLSMCFRFCEFVVCIEIQADVCTSCMMNIERELVCSLHSYAYEVTLDLIHSGLGFLFISFVLFSLHFLYKLTIHVCVRIEIMWTQSEASSPEV